MNLFAILLTHPAPTANYRGESRLNRAPSSRKSQTVAMSVHHFTRVDAQRPSGKSSRLRGCPPIENVSIPL